MNRLTQDVETILEQAVEIASADERRAFVEQACGGDLALEGRVEKLIADYFQAGSFLERPAVAMDGLLYLLDSSVPPVVSQPTVSSPFMDRLGVEGTVREFDGTAAAQPADTQAATAVFDAAALVSTGTSPVIPGYTIEGELGRGGMGVVYRARTTKLDRSVALKMILAAEHAGHEAAVRFLAEAQAIARVQHPNIVQIFHIDQHGGHPYFEMEYVGGGSLAARLDGSPRPPREAARLLEILARAMAEAHRQGIVHRDLKPANILLTQDGVPKVADFGLAKVMNVESGLTRTDSVMGSPSYMAPEQAGGKTKVVGPAADLYALGVILYELLTGRPPFQGATLLETLEQLKTREPVPPSRLVPGLPRDVETIVLKCLRKDPDERYASAWELAEDLARFQCGEPILARPVAWPERTWRWCQRNAALTSSLAAIALTMAAAIVVTLFFWLRAEKARIAEAARARSETSAKLDADAARRDVQRQLIDLCGASGLKAAQDGDHSLALLWFARRRATRGPRTGSGRIESNPGYKLAKASVPPRGNLHCCGLPGRARSLRDPGLLARWKLSSGRGQHARMRRLGSSAEPVRLLAERCGQRDGGGLAARNRTAGRCRQRWTSSVACAARIPACGRIGGSVGGHRSRVQSRQQAARLGRTGKVRGSGIRVPRVTSPTYLLTPSR